MAVRDSIELVLLAAIWGASFLFLRVAAPAFGPIALIAVRIGVGAAFLLPALLARGAVREMRGRLLHVVWIGIVNSTLPFCLFAYASLSMTAGLVAILNATSPLWGGVVAHVWLKERLDRSRVSGLLVGVAGVAFLVWGKASFRPGGGAMAVAAALAAALCYGIGACGIRRFLGGANSTAVAAGSQVAGALVLIPPAIATWPDGPLSAEVWGAAVALGAICTGLGYLLYFPLIARIGPSRAIAVTFLIPPFALAWGLLFLGEAITWRTLVGAAVILAGTALATGIVRLPARASVRGRRAPR